MNRLIRSVAFVLRGGTRRYPSPSLVVSITALVVALGGAGYSATGGNFILGQANKATTQTALSASLAGIALKDLEPAHGCKSHGAAPERRQRSSSVHGELVRKGSLPERRPA